MKNCKPRAGLDSELRHTAEGLILVLFAGLIFWGAVGAVYWVLS